MLWMEELAQTVTETFPQKEKYCCQCGLSTTGPAHFGNYREIVIAYAVARALEEQGQTGEVLLSFDDYDRYKKLATGTPAHYQQYIGMPCCDVPSPHHVSTGYAQYYEEQTLNELKRLAISVQPVCQRERYRGHVYDSWLQKALNRRRDIFDVIASYKTQSFTETDRESFFPVSVYCSRCGKDTTQVVSYEEHTGQLCYRCQCGNQESAPLTQLQVKAIFKVDWPMRWRVEKVVFEPAGKSHCEPNGAVQVSGQLCKEIFDWEPPVTACYEFVSLRRAGNRMSKTRGEVISMDETLKVFGRDMVVWLLGAPSPHQPIALSLKQGVEDLFARYEAFLCSERSEDRRLRAILQIRESACLPSFAKICRQGTAWGKSSEALLQEMGTERTAEAVAKVERVLYWLEHHSNRPCYRIQWGQSVELEHGETAMLAAMEQALREQEGTDGTQILAEGWGAQWKQCSQLLSLALFGTKEGPPVRRIFRGYARKEIQGRLEEVLRERGEKNEGL